MKQRGFAKVPCHFVIGGVALREGRRGAAEERELPIHDDVISDIDAPGANSVHQIGLGPGIQQHQQGPAAPQIAFQSVVLFIEQGPRGTRRDHHIGVVRHVSRCRQQQGLDLVVLVPEGIRRAGVALFLARRFALDSPLVVALEEVHLALAGARELHHRVGDVFLGHLVDLNRLGAQ